MAARLLPAEQTWCPQSGPHHRDGADALGGGRRCAGAAGPDADGAARAVSGAPCIALGQMVGYPWVVPISHGWRLICLTQAKSLQQMGFGSHPVCSPSAASMGAHVECFSEVNAVDTRHKLYEHRAFRAVLERVSWCGSGVVEKGLENCSGCLQSFWKNVCLM